MPNMGSSVLLIISFSLTALAIDRLGCIKYPFHYQNLPKWLSYVVIFLCWMLGTIHFLLRKIFPQVNSLKSTQISYVVIVSVLTIILCVSNTLIFKETQRHIKAISSSMISYIEINNTSVATNKNIITIAPLTYDSTSTAKLRKRFIQKKEIRAAYICIFMSHLISFSGFHYMLTVVLASYVLKRI